MSAPFSTSWWARVLPAIAGLLLVGWLGSGIYTVSGSEGEIGVARRFGRVINGRVAPGIHWNAPWPVGDVIVVKAAEPFTMSVGYKLADKLRNLPPRPEEVQWLTGDTNIIEIRAILQYVVVDPVRFSYGSGDAPGLVLRTVAEAVFTEVVGGMEVDEVLTTGKREILDSVRDEVNERLEDYDLGIEVVTASFESIDPAPMVQGAFREVQNAEADRERMVSLARGEANDLLPKAEGEARAIVEGAEASKDARIQAAKGEAHRFARILEEYQRAPARTRDRLYLETMEEVLPRVRVVVIEGGGVHLIGD